MRAIKPRKARVGPKKVKYHPTPPIRKTEFTMAHRIIIIFTAATLLAACSIDVPFVPGI